jgi:Holliday junction resolvase
VTPLSPRGRYQKGRRLEYKTMRYFEASGHVCFRMAGSHSPFDVIAVRGDSIVFAQVKGGTASLTPLEREKIQGFDCPANCIRMLVKWPDRARFPLTEVIR